MNPLIKVKSNVPDDILRVELFLSNYCNYKCWYCSPESYGNTRPWPKFEEIKDNFDYFLSYYKTNFGKKKINLYIGGGEPSLWPDLIKFCHYFKEKHGCKINISTNGSRTLRWWEENRSAFDHVRISVHNEKANAEHIAKVADILYNGNVSVIASVLMDPFNWSQCIQNVEVLKNSKRKWLLTVSETIHPTITYNDDQKKFLNKRVIRHSSFWYRLKVLKDKKPKYFSPTVEFQDGTTKKLDTHEIILNKWNFFKNWECNVGLDTVFVDSLGFVRGSCGETLFQENTKFNIKDIEFIDKFKPKKLPAVCSKNICICQDEANVNKKIIPIKVA